MQRRSFLIASPMALAMQNQPRGGTIGTGGRGNLLTTEFKEVGAQMAAVCDVYEPNLQRGLKSASTGAKPYTDYRKLLEDKSLDFVVIATPDHWHSRMMVDAVDAGKDVYVEKPLAHTIEEGERMIAAVRRSKRVVQVGTQRRSAPLFLEAKQLFDQAPQGTVNLVLSYWLNHAASPPDKPLAGNLDWKQWLGNSPNREMDPHRFFNWYYYWDYSGGLMVGQAAHIIDLILWFMNADAPKAVTATGASPNLQKVEIPETTSISLEFGSFLATFAVGYHAMRYSNFLDQLSQFHGHKARFDIGREHYAVYPEDPQALDLKASAGKRDPKSFNSAVRHHIRNFLECTVSRREPNAPVHTAQRTNIALVMAIESLHKGQRITRA